MSQLTLDLIASTDEISQTAEPTSSNEKEHSQDWKEEEKAGSSGPPDERAPQPLAQAIAASAAPSRPPTPAADLIRRRVALEHLAQAREGLRDRGPSGGTNRAHQHFKSKTPPSAALPEAVFGCVALIPQDADELRSRPRIYTAVLDILCTTLTAGHALAADEFPRLREILCSRPLLDLAEDLCVAGLQCAHKSATEIPVEQQHLSSLLRRLALRARSMSTGPVMRPPHGPPSTDLVATRIHEARYTSWHEPTGLLGTHTNLHVAEIRTHLTVMLADAQQGNLGALVCLVAYAVGKMPRHFASIGLHAGGRFTAAVTDDFSIFSWCGRVLHASAPCPEPDVHLPTSDRFSAAIPTEVTELLRGRSIPASASTLSDVLGDGEDLTRVASTYLCKFNECPRSVTLERLANTLPRLAAHFASDKTIGAAAYCDFTLASKAKFHYLLARSATVQAACAQAFVASGFCGAVAVPVVSDAALNPHLTDEVVAWAVNKLAEEIVNGYRTCGSLANWGRLRQVHATLAPATAGLLHLLTGIRPRKELRIPLRSMVIPAGFLLLGDKKCSPYETRRLVAIPEVFIETLGLYLDWLHRLSVCSNVPAPIRTAIAARLKPSGCASLFFGMNANSLEPLSGRSVARQLLSVGIARGNEGRRIVERLAREGGASRVAVDAQLGHTPAGAETYASYSALRPIDLVAQVKAAMDRRLRQIGVVSPRGARVARKTKELS